MSGWTKDEEDRLRKLVNEGHTYSVIAEALGYTRSAIGGKIQRMGLFGRSERKNQYSNTNRRKPERRRTGARKSTKGIGMVPTNRVPDPPPVPVIEPPQSPADLPQPGQCKYAGGGPGQWTWCAKDALPGKPYCEYHSKIVYQEPRER